MSSELSERPAFHVRGRGILSGVGLLALYAAPPAMAFLPARLPMLMMNPPPCARISGAASRVQ